jgi:V8-like Glu-specific endopeptidase
VLDHTDFTLTKVPYQIESFLPLKEMDPTVVSPATKTHRAGISKTRIAKAALESVRNRQEGTPSRAPPLVSSPPTSAPKQHEPQTASPDLIEIGTAQTGYPWQTVGKIQVGWDSDFTIIQYEGSGVLVNQNLILTAGHIVPWDKSGWWMRFAAGYRSGEAPFGWIYISRCIGYDDSNTLAANDFAVCQLYSNLGDVCGWMGTHWWSSEDVYLNGTWSCQGYPNELPIAATNIPIQKVQAGSNDDKLMYTVEFASGPAWEGGPLWDGGLSGTVNPLVIGVLSGEIFPNSIFAGGEDIVNLVIYGIENWSQ